MSEITVVLNGYNRGYLLDRQINAIKNQTVESEIMLWYNKGEELQISVDNNIKSAYCNHNFKFHGRFAFALLAKTKYVAFFDDDCIPGRKWFEHCLTHIHNGILGGSGVYLNANNYEDSVKFGYTGTPNVDYLAEVDLVGHAWFIERDWLKYMWFEYPISWENGEDIQFSYLCKKYGNIKTFVPPLTNDRSKYPNTESQHSSDKFASYKKSNHATLRNEIVRKAVENGWKTVKNNK